MGVSTKTLNIAATQDDEFSEVVGVYDGAPALVVDDLEAPAPAWDGIVTLQARPRSAGAAWKDTLLTLNADGMVLGNVFPGFWDFRIGVKSGDGSATAGCTAFLLVGAA